MMMNEKAVSKKGRYSGNYHIFLKAFLFVYSRNDVSIILSVNVAMALLTLLVIVHEYLASQLIPYHKLAFDSAVACRHLKEIVSESKDLLVKVGKVGVIE